MLVFWACMSAYAVLAVVVAWISGELNLAFVVFAVSGLVVVSIPCHSLQKRIEAKSAIMATLKDWDESRLRALGRIVRHRLFTNARFTDEPEEAADKIVSDFLQAQNKTPIGRLALEALFQRSEIGRRKYLRGITGGRVE